MYLKSAVFENFRNIKGFSFDFDKGMNILFGGNAQGKTAVIEGIYLFAGGKSFRKAKDKEMIKSGELGSHIDITFADERRENRMSLDFRPEARKEMSLNGMKVKKISEFLGNFKSVLFCPEHLAIVKDEPSIRRSFIDAALSQLNPYYLPALTEYTKVVESKNALLKNSESYSRDDFEMLYKQYSVRLVKGSLYISMARMGYLKKLFGYVGKFLSEMTGGRDSVDYEYLYSIGPVKYMYNYEAQYLYTIFTNSEREKAAKVSLYGAHRDDFEIRLPIGSAKIFASQGQQRSIALAMKLAEGEICREETGEYPVFLFDDVLSELDRQRKNYVLENLSGKQVIVTSCDEADFSDCGSAKRIYVENGNYFYR